MVGDAREFGQYGTDVLAPQCDLNTKKSLNSMMPADFIGERRDIVHPIDDGYVLIEVEIFAEFLETGMKKADIGHGLDYCFAVECEDQSKRCMGGRVLWPEVESVEELLIGASNVVRYQLFDRH